MNLTIKECIRITSLLDQLVARAIPYKFGAEVIADNPFTLDLKLADIKGIDCSELVEWVFWHAFRIKVPDGSYNQFDVSLPLNGEAYQCGDLVFRRNKTTVNPTGAISHVGIYVGNNLVVEATPPCVVKRSLDKFAFNSPERKTEYAGIRRISLDLLVR